ncbi:MAG: vWA domain-containing protein [Bdellovibrionota bacterium]
MKEWHILPVTLSLGLAAAMMSPQSASASRFKGNTRSLSARLQCQSALTKPKKQIESFKKAAPVIVNPLSGALNFITKVYRWVFPKVDFLDEIQALRSGGGEALDKALSRDPLDFDIDVEVDPLEFGAGRFERAERDHRWDNYRYRRQERLSVEEEYQRYLSYLRSKYSPLQRLYWDANANQNPWGSGSLKKKAVELMWAQTLRRYDSSEKFKEALDQFQEFAQWAKSQRLIVSEDALVQEAERLRKTLEMTKVSYESLEDLAFLLEQYHRGEGKEFGVYLDHLDQILTKLSQLTSFSEQERELYDATQEVAKKKPSEPVHVSAKQFTEVFLSQDLGKLALDSLAREFATQKQSPENGAGAIKIDPEGLRQAASDGRLNPYLVMLQLARVNRLLLYRKEDRRPKVDTYLDRFVRSDQAHELRPALGMEEFHNFHRDGAPIELDLFRVLSGEMLAYNFPREKESPVEDRPIPTIVSILLVDRSGSMAEDSKWVVRDAFLMAFYEEAVAQMEAGIANHIVYRINFTEYVENPVRVETPLEFAKDFNLVRSGKIPSDGYTSITLAMTTALTKIYEHQKAGGEAEAANLILVTDGRDEINVQEILAERKKLRPELEIAINSISVGEGNPDIKAFVSQPPEEWLGQDKLTYQHIPVSEIKKLVDHTTYVQAIESVAKKQAVSVAFKEKVTPDEIEVLQNKLVRLLVSRNSVVESKDLLDRMQQDLFPLSEGNAAGDASINEAVRTILLIKDSPMFQSYTNAERAEFIYNFLIEAAKSHGVGYPVLIRKIGSEAKEELYKLISGESR